MFETNPDGCLEIVAEFVAIARPHRPQNFEFAGNVFEHRGQGNPSEASPALISVNDLLPQRPQNFTPSANREPQFVQATIPGMRLEWAPLLPLPCDGDGWLPVSRIERS